MPGINAIGTSDTYATSAAKILDVWTSTGGWFSVAKAAVFVQIQYGSYGSPQFSDDQELGVGAFGFIPAGATGIQFKSAVPGTPATVTAYIGSGGPAADPKATVYPEPTLAISALGNINLVPGTHPTQTVFTAVGTNAYTPPANCTGIRVTVVGGGGGGGGTIRPGAGTIGCGGGGGGGGLAEAVIPVSSLAPGPVQVTVGAGGAAGPATGGNGFGGGTSSFIDNNGTGTTWASATGGGGGGGTLAGVAPPTTSGGNAGPGVGTVGTILLSGSPSEIGGGYSTTSVFSGGGGASALGGGNGGSVFGGSGGQNGSLGGGGSGACAEPTSLAAAGGAGGSGIVIIDEYYN